MSQEEALTILKTGANVFLTGEPGSGKTHTINTYVAYLREKGIEPAITASTGIAATHIKGMTIHSWSGIGIKTRLTEYDLDKIASNERVTERILHTHVLIIDEVSMLQADVLQMVEIVTRAIKRNSRPFGGMQVVLVGDFFQLPPIVKNIKAESEELFEIKGKTPFAYTSSAWKSLNPVVCYLEEQHRADDEVLLTILSALRSGEYDEEHIEKIKSRLTEGSVPKGVVQLFSHNADVDRINEEELQKVKGNSRSYTMKAQGNPLAVENLKKGCLSPEKLMLKVEAHVMFTKNNPSGSFVNGTLGVVTSFAENGLPVVKTRSNKRIMVEPMEWVMEEDGKVKAKIIQIPLRLAWAITVHKSQGMSLDAAVIDLSQTFEYGQGYVALSRVRTLKGLHLLGINERAFKVHPEALQFDAEFRAQSAAASRVFLSMKRGEIEDMHERFVRTFSR